MGPRELFTATRTRVAKNWKKNHAREGTEKIPRVGYSTAIEREARNYSFWDSCSNQAYANKASRSTDRIRNLQDKIFMVKNVGSRACGWLSRWNM